MNEPLPRIQRPATYQDVLDAPPNKVAELVNGALHLQPRPRARHGFASSRLGARINSDFDSGDHGPGGWWIIDEPELHFGDDVVVPDIAGWRRETMPEFPDTAAIDQAPDWICEVLSPSTRQFDLTEKRDVYLQERVGHLWFVDPGVRTLEAFELKDETWSLLTALKDNDPVSVPPFDAIEFPLSTLWPD